MPTLRKPRKTIHSHKGLLYRLLQSLIFLTFALLLAGGLSVFVNALGYGGVVAFEEFNVHLGPEDVR